MNNWAGKRLLDVIRRKIWPGDRYARWHGATVGKGCRVLSPVFSEPELVQIGDRVTISTNVTLLTHDGSTWLFRDHKGRRFDYRRVKVGDDVFIGAGSIVMPGVEIGNRVIIGAGSVVTKSIPSGCVVAGNPARFVKKYEELEALALEGFPSEETIGGVISRNSIGSIARKGFRPYLTAITREIP